MTIGRKTSRHGRMLLAVAVSCLMTACAPPTPVTDRDDPEQVDRVKIPEVDACRQLVPDDILKSTNAIATVECATPHTAQTYAASELPDDFDDAEYETETAVTLGAETCAEEFQTFLGADESTVLRTVLTWAQFRPSRRAWDEGARWFRCDLIGPPTDDDSFANLPTDAEGLLQGRPKDKWLACSTGETVDDGVRVPCSRPHDWRAVTTIKVGDPDESYPGDTDVEVTTRDFCSDSVQAWLNYPEDFDFGYTWFGEDQWETGNRRSVCWAKTPE